MPTGKLYYYAVCKTQQRGKVAKALFTSSPILAIIAVPFGLKNYISMQYNICCLFVFTLCCTVVRCCIVLMLCFYSELYDVL